MTSRNFTATLSDTMASRKALVLLHKINDTRPSFNGRTVRSFIIDPSDIERIITNGAMAMSLDPRGFTPHHDRQLDQAADYLRQLAAGLNNQAEEVRRQRAERDQGLANVTLIARTTQEEV